MKVDSDTLAKNQFWILFGVLVPLIFLVMIWLKTVSASSNLDAKQKLEDHNQKLEQLVQQPVTGNPDLNDLLEREKELETRKTEIWKESFEIQKGLLTWPGELQKKLGELTFGDPLSADPNENATLCGQYARPNMYQPQVDELLNFFKQRKVRVLQEERDFEPIHFKDNKVLTYVRDWAAKNKAPTYEEVWLAQEDIWVQREVLRAIKEALNTVASFRKVEGPADLKQGELFRQHFENSQWRLDLVLAHKDPRYLLRGRIKNVANRPLMLGKIYFRVQLHNANADPLVVPVEGDTLPAGKEIAIPDISLDLANRPDGLISVAQVYEWRNSPIRRIDQIALTAQSYRTYEPLKMHRMSKTPTPEAAADPTGKAATPPPPAGGDAPKGPNLTDYGLVRDRYCDVTEQVRRYPLGLVLLVDQEHMAEVLTALANSPLRLQIVQTGWHHFRDRLENPEAPKVEGEQQPMADAAKPPEGDAAQAANLVELTIYCIASLYERYPPKTAAPAGEVVPAAAGKAP